MAFLLVRFVIIYLAIILIVPWLLQLIELRDYASGIDLPAFWGAAALSASQYIRKTGKSLTNRFQVIISVVFVLVATVIKTIIFLIYRNEFPETEFSEFLFFYMVLGIPYGIAAYIFIRLTSKGIAEETTNKALKQGRAK